MPKRLPPECDYWCNFRPCLHKGWDRGPYIRGQGYTSYHKKPIYVCMRRFLEGCPDGLSTSGANLTGIGCVSSPLRPSLSKSESWPHT